MLTILLLLTKQLIPVTSYRLQSNTTRRKKGTLLKNFAAKKMRRLPIAH